MERDVTFGQFTINNCRRPGQRLNPVETWKAYEQSWFWDWRFERMLRYVEFRPITPSSTPLAVANTSHN